MKKQNMFAVVMVVSFVFSSISALAADRCTGKISRTLLQSEAVANFYFDMKIHELICSYVLDGKELQAVEDRVLVARTQIKPTLITAQDKMVAYFGSEGAYETFYARLGNHVSFLNLPQPCERATELANMMVKSNAKSRGDIAKNYQPYFESLVAQYEAKAGKPFRRICDPLPQN